MKPHDTHIISVTRRRCGLYSLASALALVPWLVAAEIPRAPLVDPTPDQEERLAAILEAGRALL